MYEKLPKPSIQGVSSDGLVTKQDVICSIKELTRSLSLKADGLNPQGLDRKLRMV